MANAPRGAGATVEFRHEELADRDERRMMLGHWHSVTDLLVNHFA
ncbi:transcriptional regulator of NAD metabolism [Okibacterium sp. HSC-33S16]|nr:transcriptional regulator of NAD metabolism [Okibacterium sp. HSC-33S16]